MQRYPEPLLASHWLHAGQSQWTGSGRRDEEKRIDVVNSEGIKSQPPFSENNFPNTKIKAQYGNNLIVWTSCLSYSKCPSWTRTPVFGPLQMTPLEKHCTMCQLEAPGFTQQWITGFTNCWVFNQYLFYHEDADLLSFFLFIFLIHPLSTSVFIPTSCCVNHTEADREDDYEKCDPFPVCVLQCAAYCSGVQLHLEFLQVEPLLGLAGIQVMVEVSCCVAETVEFSVWSEQDCGGSFLIGHPRVPALPAPGGEKSCSVLTDWMFLKWYTMIYA